MNGLAAVILMQVENAPAPSIVEMIFPFAMILVIFYFLLIRPQQKRQKDHEAMLKAIEKGDAVVTSGGIHGRVTGVTDDILTVEIAVLKGDRVRVKVARSKVESVDKAKGGDGS